METTKVGKMGVTIIPNGIRKIFHIREGDELEWSIEEGKIVVRKKALINRESVKNRFENLRKKAPECFTEKESEDEDKWITKEWTLTKFGQ